jgi:CheY-like chemotaxis protein
MESNSNQPDDPGPLTVLLVEDNPTDVFVIKEVLEGCGLNFRPRVVSDGRDALRYLEDLDRDHSSPPPALVLLDLNIPKVDGIEVLRQLRRAPRCKGTPVVVVTSSTADQDRAAAERLGAEAYFQKPKDLTAYMELGQVIKRVLHIPEEGGGR